MKITNIQSMVLSMPMSLDGPTPSSAGVPRTTADQVLVRVDTDAGITGWGESFGIRAAHATKAMLDTVVAPFALGRDATAISTLHGELQRTLNSSGRNGPAMHALSGLDIAL
jgi:L-alanine-DL-glutamate epimerase-like enolase superfamily enzyme